MVDNIKMEKPQQNVLIATAIISFVSTVLVIVSFATGQWVNAEATLENAFSNSEISYGLVSGSLTRSLLATRTEFDLTVTCLYSENVCAFSCQAGQEERENEIKSMLNGEEIPNCPVRQKSGASVRKFSTENVTKIRELGVGTPPEAFLNAALWTTVIVLMSLLLTSAATSCVFSVVNIFYGPIFVKRDIELYVSNGVSMFMSVLVLSSYGALFDGYITNNIAITDTLRPVATYDSEGMASFGFSYWLNLVVLYMHLGNIGLVIWRKYLIKREPPPPVITVAKNVTTTLLY